MYIPNYITVSGVNPIALWIQQLYFFMKTLPKLHMQPQWPYTFRFLYKYWLPLDKTIILYFSGQREDEYSQLSLHLHKQTAKGLFPKMRQTKVRGSVSHLPMQFYTCTPPLLMSQLQVFHLIKYLHLNSLLQTLHVVLTNSSKTPSTFQLPHAQVKQQYSMN